MTEARDTFAKRSDAYVAARPRYPAALYDWIVTQCANVGTAWDCATGNGQAASDLSSRFDTVHASDISSEQIEHGISTANVIYRAESAEATSYPDNSFDFIAVAQALHWFDFERFWPEVSRVAKPGAIFCAWGYAWFSSHPDVEHELVLPFRKLIEPYWATNNRLLWDGYRASDVRFPYERIGTPQLSIELMWTVPELIAYMQTWSASKRAAENPEINTKLRNLVERATARFADLAPLNIAMPLKIIAGRIAA